MATNIQEDDHGGGGGGGAWPFLVGGVICLVNSVNERDYYLLNSIITPVGL